MYPWKHKVTVQIFCCWREGCLFLFLTDAVHYATPCLQFRIDNLINVAKACNSKPGFFVWEICIIKLFHTAEGPHSCRNIYAFKMLRWQNYIYTLNQGCYLDNSMSPIVFSCECFITAQCQFITKYKGSLQMTTCVTSKFCRLTSQGMMKEMISTSKVWWEHTESHSQRNVTFCWLKAASFHPLRPLYNQKRTTEKMYSCDLFYSELPLESQ